MEDTKRVAELLSEHFGKPTQTIVVVAETFGMPQKFKDENPTLSVVAVTRR
jgi:hypothetical protein